jgi:hypothetical protein
VADPIGACRKKVITILVDPDTGVPVTVTGGAITVTGTFTVTPASQNQTTNTVVAVGSGASVQLVALNAARRGLLIINQGTANVHIRFGAAATTAQFYLAPGQGLQLSGASFIDTQAVNAIAASGTQDVSVLEW